MAAASRPTDFALFFFYLMYMDTAATIPTGAMAERWRFLPFVFFGLFMSMVLFPVYAQWVWGGGWLARLGVNAAAWATASSISPARPWFTWSAAGPRLVGAYLIGPRLGKFRPDGRPNPLPAHNVPMYMTGTLILTFGWFGFNSGAALKDADPVAARRAGQHHPGGGGRCLRGHDLHLDALQEARRQLPLQRRPGRPGGDHGRLRLRRPVGGRADRRRGRHDRDRQRLVVERVLKIDDPVGAISVHGVGGVWGVLALGLFADGTHGDALNGVAGSVRGLFYGDASQLVAQLIGVGACLLWVLPVTLIFLLIVRRYVGLRVIAVVEQQGLDVPELGTLGYQVEDAKFADSRYRYVDPRLGQRAAGPGQGVHGASRWHRPGLDAENLVGPLPDRQSPADGRLQGRVPVHDDGARQPLPLPGRRPRDSAREPGTAVQGGGVGQPGHGAGG